MIAIRSVRWLPISCVPVLMLAASCTEVPNARPPEPAAQDAPPPAAPPPPTSGPDHPPDREQPSSTTAKPAASVCNKPECGPAPGLPNWQCADGTGIGGSLCVRGS